MDKRIVIVIASILFLLFGFLIYRLFFSHEERITPVLVLEGIRNNQTLVDSVITFIDQTPKAKTWSWDFGDHQMASGQKVSHSFIEPGSYRIKLTVTTENGVAMDSSKVIEVKPDLQSFNASIVVTYSVSAKKVKVGAPVQFSNLTKETTEAKWDFGDGAQANGLTTEHIYNTAGEYKVRLFTTGGYGRAKDTGTLVIVENPVAIPVAKPTPVVKPNRPKTHQSASQHPVNLGDGGKLHEIREVKIDPKK